jgi:hypothetical protein
MTLILIICVNVNKVTGCEGQRASNLCPCLRDVWIVAVTTVIPNEMMGSQGHWHNPLALHSSSFN